MVQQTLKITETYQKCTSTATTLMIAYTASGDPGVKGLKGGASGLSTLTFMVLMLTTSCSMLLSLMFITC